MPGTLDYKWSWLYLFGTGDSSVGDIFGRGGNSRMRWSLLGWKCCYELMEFWKVLAEPTEWARWHGLLEWGWPLGHVSTSWWWLILGDYRCPPLFRLLKPVEERSLYDKPCVFLNVWAEWDLNYKCRSSWFAWRLRGSLKTCMLIDRTGPKSMTGVL